jgi:aubergine
MLVGVDSCASGGHSIMGACGTINSTFSSTTSAFTAFDGNERKFQAMVTVVLKCLEGYVVRNKGVPSEMIVFMNCSPADQVNLYQQNFSRPIQEHIQKAHGGSIRLTVLMVTLRNDERFFCMGKDKNSQQTMIVNVPPGTVVAKDVVSPHYDFFLVSQAAFKGTAVPNHYKVITNESKLEEGHLQELVFFQCFNYFNWSGSIKIPGVLMYTKKCVKFAAEVLGGEEVSSICVSKPYFI